MVLVQLAVNMQKNAKDPFLSPGTKIKSNWIMDLHIKPDKLKLIEQGVEKRLEHMGTEENFLNKTLMVYSLRTSIDKWDLIKLQSFSKAKDNCQQDKTSTNRLENIFINPTSKRGLISNVYKETIDSRESNNLIKNGTQGGSSIGWSS